MPRSLLDGADLPLLRGLMADGGAALAVCLVDAGLLQFDGSDPAWEDRDRLVLAGGRVGEAVRTRLRAAGADPEQITTFAASGGEAMAVAFGAAVASDLDGNVWRSWCVLDEQACDDGRVWEVARAAATGTRGLAVLVDGAGTEKLWTACGWRVQQAPYDDPAWLLGALDHVGRDATTAVLVHG